MRIIYNDGIYIRNIYTAFYDIGTDQHIVFLVHEIEYGIFQLVTIHLAMCIGDTNIRTKSLYQSFHLCKAIHPVMNEEDLPASFGFVINNIPYRIFIKDHHFRLYGLAVGRWRIDDTQIPRTH